MNFVIQIILTLGLISILSVWYILFSPVFISTGLVVGHVTYLLRGKEKKELNKSLKSILVAGYILLVISIALIMLIKKANSIN